MNLKKQTVSGVKWLLAGSFSQKAISLITTVVLARILSPEDFGLFALAFVAINALGLFKSIGFDSAIVQRKSNVEKAANTAFFIIPLFGCVIYLILTISAPMIGRFFNNQEVASVIKSLGVIFIISCFGRVPAALLQRNMKFKRISVIEVSEAVLYGVSAIVLAVIGMGIWSLVIAYILRTLLRNILMWIFSGWRPKFEFDIKIALEMFHFGKFIFLSGLVWFLRTNLANLLVGKILGLTALGLYAIAFNISNFNAQYLGGKVHQVVFPAYSKLQNDLSTMKSAVLKIIQHVSIIALPIGIGIFLSAKELLTFVYGEKWIAATSVLKILVWAGIFNTLSASLSGVFLACGKPKLEFWIKTIQVLIFFVFISPMAKIFGINGVGVIVSISGFIVCVITLAWIMNILSIDLKELYFSLKPASVSSLVMASGMFLLKGVFAKQSLGVFLRYNFIALFLTAAIIYCISLYKIDKILFRQIKGMVF